MVSIMLSAYNNNNEIIIPFKNTYEENEILKDKYIFYCNCCQEIVIMKNGQEKTPHFSHKKNSSCPASIGETEIHVLTKMSIYESLVENGVDAYIERPFKITDEMKDKFKNTNSYSDLIKIFTLKKISNTFFDKFLKRNLSRPDVCFFLDGQLIAIEVQKSRLAEVDFLLRTLMYYILGIPVLWIIPQENIFLNDQKNNPISKITDHALLSKYYEEVKTNGNEHYYFKVNPLYKLLKRYYYGQIYCWNFYDKRLRIYSIRPYYKSLKRLMLENIQTDLVLNFKSQKIQRDFEMKKYIDSLLWTKPIYNRTCQEIRTIDSENL